MLFGWPLWGGELAFLTFVIPAKAGTQCWGKPTPALGSRFRGNDEIMRRGISASAGKPPFHFAAHAKWGPASLPTPTIRSCLQPLAPVHPGPLLLRSAARKTIRRRAHGTNPAAVWSAPFRGPAAPGKPFIIWSEPLPKQSLLSGDGLHFHSDRVRFNSWELPRSVTGVSVYVLVDPLRFLRVGLATILRVPVVRRLCRPMIGS